MRNRNITDSILNCLYDHYTVNGVRIEGQSISFVQKSAREDGWRTGNLADFQDQLLELGFDVDAGINSRGQAATVVSI